MLIKIDNKDHMVKAMVCPNSIYAVEVINGRDKFDKDGNKSTVYGIIAHTEFGNLKVFSVDPETVNKSLQQLRCDIPDFDYSFIKIKTSENISFGKNSQDVFNAFYIRKQSIKLMNYSFKERDFNSPSFHISLAMKTSAGAEGLELEFLTKDEADVAFDALENMIM
jgi:hypothetical protein